MEGLIVLFIGSSSFTGVFKCNHADIADAIDVEIREGEWNTEEENEMEMIKGSERLFG